MRAGMYPACVHYYEFIQIQHKKCAFMFVFEEEGLQNGFKG